MLKRIFHILITASLVFLMMLSGVAHEFVHSFTGHEDTVHRMDDGHQPGTMSFEKEHHHCDFLHFPTPVFITSSFHLHFQQEQEHTEQFRLADLVVFTRPGGHTALRGPPIAA